MRRYSERGDVMLSSPRRPGLCRRCFNATTRCTRAHKHWVAQIAEQRLWPLLVLPSDSNEPLYFVDFLINKVNRPSGGDADFEKPRINDAASNRSAADGMINSSVGLASVAWWSRIGTAAVRQSLCVSRGRNSQILSRRGFGSNSQHQMQSIPKLKQSNF